MAFPFVQSLPLVGTRESDTLDFKREVARVPGRPSADRFELAKDVASFANQSGGTIMIGVDGGSICRRFDPLTEADADWLTREYEEAVRDRCAPPPSIRTEKLACDGGVILAVHVPPFPLTVAVKVKGDQTDGYGSDAWVFFLRIASQNRPFSA